jgi:peroxiredoxin
MDVKEIDTPIEELIDQSNEFTKEMGLETKSGDKKK